MFVAEYFPPISRELAVTSPSNQEGSFGVKLVSHANLVLSGWWAQWVCMPVTIWCSKGLKGPNWNWSSKVSINVLNKILCYRNTFVTLDSLKNIINSMFLFSLSFYFQITKEEVSNRPVILFGLCKYFLCIHQSYRSIHYIGVPVQNWPIGH